MWQGVGLGLFALLMQFSKGCGTMFAFLVNFIEWDLLHWTCNWVEFQNTFELFCVWNLLDLVSHIFSIVTHTQPKTGVHPTQWFLHRYHISTKHGSITVLRTRYDIMQKRRIFQYLSCDFIEVDHVLQIYPPLTSGRGNLPFYRDFFEFRESFLTMNTAKKTHAVLKIRIIHCNQTKQKYFKFRTFCLTFKVLHPLGEAN